MSITVTTREFFPKATTSQDHLEWEKNLRIEGGAIHCSIVDDSADWVLVSEWDLIGPKADMSITKN